jgi:hypothetical protein
VNRLTGQPREDFLAAYADRIRRWNRQINLVSRQDTDERLNSLFRQCVEGFRALLADQENTLGAGPVRYFDLGSGGGLPGIIWHHLLDTCGLRPDTTLVEPRIKRAWFLERLNQLPGILPFSVLTGRWGDPLPEIEEPDGARPVLISLKALHLTDPEVLGGLVRVSAGSSSCPVLIARFYPPDQMLDADLAAHLEWPAPADPVSVGPRVLVWQGGRLLTWDAPTGESAAGESASGEGASLVLSLYS